MARCGCAEECRCIVTGGDCIEVTGNGNPGAPYNVNLLVDPDENNQLVCNDPDGAYVPPPSIEVDDTDCIDLSGTGYPGDPVTADLVVDPDAANLSICGASGLITELFTADGDCVALTGAGTVADPLTPETVLSADSGNIAECRANGLFVPTSGVGSINIYGYIYRSGSQVIPASLSNGADGKIQFNSTVSDVGAIVDIANNRMVIPAGGSGYYFMRASVLTDSTNPDSSGADQWVIGPKILVNGGISAQTSVARYGSTPDRTEVTTLLALSAGDLVEVHYEAWNTGSTLAACTIFGGFDTSFICCQVGG